MAMRKKKIDVPAEAKTAEIELELMPKQVRKSRKAKKIKGAAFNASILPWAPRNGFSWPHLQ